MAEGGHGFQFPGQTPAGFGITKVIKNRQSITGQSAWLSALGGRPEDQTGSAADPAEVAQNGKIDIIIIRGDRGLCDDVFLIVGQKPPAGMVGHDLIIVRMCHKNLRMDKKRAAKTAHFPIVKP